MTNEFPEVPKFFDKNGEEILPGTVIIAIKNRPVKIIEIKWHEEAEMYYLYGHNIFGDMDQYSDIFADVSSTQFEIVHPEPEEEIEEVEEP